MVADIRFTHFLKNIGAINTFEFTSTMLAFPNVEKDMHKAYQLFYDFYKYNYYIESETKISRYDIGVALMDGTYLPQNYEKAHEYLMDYIPTLENIREEIAKYENEKIADALYRLSQMYRFGHGVTPNEHRANQYLELAALCGNKKAQSVVSSKIVNIGDE